MERQHIFVSPKLAYSSPINSISSVSLPGRPTISISNVMVASAGILGFPADDGLPFWPNANLPCRFVEI